MVYLKLGQILLNQGLITEEQLNRAIAAQKQEQGRIGEIFIKLGIIKDPLRIPLDHDIKVVVQEYLGGGRGQSGPMFERFLLTS